MCKILQGDYVVLNSGGPVMQVRTSLRDGMLSCVWHGLDGQMESIFDPRCVSKLDIPFPAY